MERTFTLFCMPYAGAGASAYHKFQPHYNESITLHTVELPGRGKYFRIPLLTDISEMVECIFKQLRHDVRPPYAIYGHSMGTLLGYLLALRIRQAGLPLPAHLILSGRHGPTVSGSTRNWHLLPSQQFLEKIKSLGGIPEQILQEKELMELFLPIFKADFQAISEFRYTPEDPLDVPVTVLMGTEEGYSVEDAQEWRHITTHELTVKEFPGNHFFIFDHAAEISRLITRLLKPVL